VQRRGVGEDLVVPGELVLERGLLDADLVLDVPEPHGLGGVAVVGAHHPLQPAQRHDLHHRGAGGQEHHVGQPGAVHAHHHVARVDEPPDLRDVVGHVGLVDHGIEPHLLRGAHHGGQVQQEPRAPARDDQQPGLIRAEGRGRVPRQRERAAEEPREVWRREPVGDELPVRAEADHGAGEAVRLPRRAGLGEVEDRVPRQSAQQPVVLDQPPRRHVGHHQLYVPSVLLRGGVERDEHVGEVVEDVARVPADRERHRGGRVRRRAPRRGVGRRRGAHSDLRTSRGPCTSRRPSAGTAAPCATGRSPPGPRPRTTTRSRPSGCLRRSRTRRTGSWRSRTAAAAPLAALAAPGASPDDPQLAASPLHKIQTTTSHHSCCCDGLGVPRARRAGLVS
jgi:hypothetical protein